MLPTEKTKIETQFQALRGYIYGEPKVGKTTFAASFPDPLIIATEVGYAHLRVHKVDIPDWLTFKSLVTELKASKRFSTLVVDTVDLLWDQCAAYICKKKNLEYLGDAEFGKGYKLARDEFLSAINILVHTGRGILFISHSETKTITTRTSTLSRTLSSLSATARKVILPLVDYVGYCYATEKGERIITFEPKESIEAGDRSGRLPAWSPLNYSTLMSHFNKTTQGENNHGETQKKVARKITRSA